MNRRRVLLGTGTLAAGTVGGIVTLSDNATATVEGEFSIPNGEAVLTDTTLQDVLLEVTADWSFDANADCHAIELELHVGATVDTMDMLARHERDDLGTDSLTGTETLSGSIINTSDYSIDNFQPTNGELSTGVVSALKFYVLRNGSVVAEAEQTETFDVTVSEQELTISASVGGTGEVSFETGPTATPSG